jgi:hypothetical protein
LVVKIDTVPFPHDFSEDGDPKDIQKRVSQAAKRRKKLGKKLLGPTGLNAAQHDYLGSADVRFATMMEAAKELPYDQRKKVLDYLQMASDLNPWKPITEPVYLRAKKKPDGGNRFYFEFDIRNKTAQIIAADMLRPLFQPAPFQCDVAGRGVPYAIASARKYIEQGYRYGLHLDIKKHFDSFSHSAILGPAISMTKDFKSAVLTGKHYKVKYASTSVPIDVLTQYTSYVASAGIPQGSSVSPLVAAFFMSKLDLGKLPEDVVVLNYVDDFLLLGKTASSLDAGSHALQSALTDLSAGDFVLVEKFDNKPNGFTFLGHDFSIDAEGTPHILVNDVSADQFLLRYMGRADGLLKDASLIKKKSSSAAAVIDAIAALVKELIRWVKSWVLAYREADDMQAHQSHFRLEIAKLCEELGVASGDQLWKDTLAKEPMRYLFAYTSS